MLFLSGGRRSYRSNYHRYEGFPGLIVPHAGQRQLICYYDGLVREPIDARGGRDRLFAEFNARQ